MCTRVCERVSDKKCVSVLSACAPARVSVRACVPPHVPSYVGLRS